MGLLPVLGMLVYSVGLIGAGYCAVMLLSGRWPLLPDNGWILACACVGGGWFAASMAAPDWNPPTMLGLFAPFALMALVSVIATVRARRRQAGKNASSVRVRH